MTPADASKLVAVLVAAFPNARVTSGTSAVYERFLADLDYRDVDEAVAVLVATCKFLPTVAEIRDAVAKSRSGALTAPSAEEAWGMVLREVGRRGRYRLPEFTHPAIEAAVSAMGWVNICDSENQVADRAHFFRTYDAALATSTRRENVGRLLEHRRQNQLEPAGGVVKRVLALVGSGEER